MRAAHLLLSVITAVAAQHRRTVHPYIADQDVKDVTGMHVGDVSFVAQNASWIVPFYFNVETTTGGDVLLLPFLVDKTEDLRWHSCYSVTATMCCVMQQASMFLNPHATALRRACEQQSAGIEKLNNERAFTTTLDQHTVRVWSERAGTHAVTVAVSVQVATFTNSTHSLSTHKLRSHRKQNSASINFGMLFVVALPGNSTARLQTQQPVEAMYKHISLPNKVTESSTRVAQQLYQSCGDSTKPANSLWRPHQAASSLCSWACRPGFVRCLQPQWWNSTVWDSSALVKHADPDVAYNCVPLRYRGKALRIKVTVELPPLDSDLSFTRQLVLIKLQLGEKLAISPCNIQIFHTISYRASARRRLLQSNTDTIDLMLYTDETNSSQAVMHAVIKRSLLLAGLDVRDMTVDELFATIVYSPLRDMVVVALWFTLILTVLFNVLLPYTQQPLTTCLAFLTVALLRRKTFAIICITLLLLTYALSTWSYLLDVFIPHVQQSNIIRFGFLWGSLLTAVVLLVICCFMARFCRK